MSAGKTLLLVEDEPIIAMAERLGLERIGYSVVHVGTGADAIREASRNPSIDLVLMDIDLGGGMDGTEAAATILRERDVPVLFLSSHMEKDVVERTERITNYGYVVKNSSFTVLDASIKMAFKLFESNRAVRATEERFRHILENSLEAVTLIGADGRVAYESPSVARITGYDIVERIGRSGFETVYPEDLPSVAGKLRDLAAVPGSQVRDFRFRAVHPDGSVWHAEATATNLLDDPSVRAIVINYRDVTQRRTAEEAVRNQLREKETLLTEVHHRIKNSIATVEASLMLQLESTPDDGAKAALRDAIARVGSMKAVYDALLVSGEYGELSTGDYIASLVRSIRGIFPGKDGVGIECELEDFSLPVKRAAALGAVLNELLTNSMKYAFVGLDRGRIDVRLARDADGISLTVKDDGIGLPDGFDPAATDSLGLTIVRLLTQQLGGILVLEDDGGVRATVRFPA